MRKLLILLLFTTTLSAQFDFKRGCEVYAHYNVEVPRSLDLDQDSTIVYNCHGGIDWPFRVWDSLTSIKFIPTKDENARINVYFASNDGDFIPPIRFEESVIAYAFLPGGPREGEIWVNIPVMERIGNQLFGEVLLHELGHTLGMEHLAEQVAVMYPYFIAGKTELTNFDKELFFNHYPGSQYREEVEPSDPDNKFDTEGMITLIVILLLLAALITFNMPKVDRIGVLAILSLAMVGCDDPVQDINALMEKHGFEYPDELPHDPNNPLTPELIAAGEFNYFNNQLSVSGRVSCGTCHHPNFAFTSGSKEFIGGLGRGGTGEGPNRRIDPEYAGPLDAPGIKAPTSLGVAYRDILGWSGRFGECPPNTEDTTGKRGAYAQALVALRGHEQLFQTPERETLSNEFIEKMTRAFPYMKEEFENRTMNDSLLSDCIAKTLDAFQRAIPFAHAKIYSEINTWPVQDIIAMKVFAEKCMSCHNKPDFSGEISSIGRPPIPFSPDDRGEFLNGINDGQRLTPPLLDLAKHACYTADCKLETLEETVEYHNEALSLEMSELEVNELSRFLKQYTAL